MKELAFLNGVFSPIDQARVSIEDRGFQFGDGVYEVVAVYNGRPFLMAEHMRRLRNSLEATNIELDLDAQPLEPIILEGLQKTEAVGRAMVYIQITRGVAPRSHMFPKGMTPTIVMTFKPMPELSPELRARGASLMTTEDVRWSNCFVKAITLLPNVLVKTEAIRSGYDDAIFLTSSGVVRECTSANIFIVRDGMIMTPVRTQNVLHGITQGFLMECAGAIGMKLEECEFDLATMLAADEVFISSTTVEVLGVTRIDGTPIGDGRVGDLTRKLHESYKVRAHEITRGPTSMAG
ncbi:MAG: D-amino acid aminotransferase [Planctomycetota bacterium]